MAKFPYVLVDLTHVLHGAIPTWAGTPEFHHTCEKDYDPVAEYKFKKHEIDMKEGVGTHMDAPAHCHPGGKTIDQLPLTSLFVPCAIIDVSSVAHEHYSVSVQDIQNFEKEHGIIEDGTLVLIRSGWDQFWNNPEKYRNNYLFPDISAEAAQELLKRNVAGIGIDTLSPDRGENGFPVHKLFLESGKYMIENVANLDKMPATGAFVAALPMNITGGTEAPVRLVGLIPAE